jgi:hypothetical protein
MYWSFKTIPQRLKPGNALDMLGGTAKAMPFQSKYFQDFHVHAIALRLTTNNLFGMDG